MLIHQLFSRSQSACLPPLLTTLTPHLISPPLFRLEAVETDEWWGGLRRCSESRMERLPDLQSHLLNKPGKPNVTCLPHWKLHPFSVPGAFNSWYFSTRNLKVTLAYCYLHFCPGLKSEEDHTINEVHIRLTMVFNFFLNSLVLQTLCNSGSMHMSFFSFKKRLLCSCLWLFTPKHNP